jgi:hypothetical protein
MQRIRLGRISAVVAAVCAAGVLNNGDAVALMVANAVEPDYTVAPVAGQHHIDVEESGLISVLALESRMRLPNLRGARFQPMACTFDARAQQRACRSREQSDSISSAVSFRMRDGSGRMQSSFDAATTDSVTMQSAFSTIAHDKGGKPVTHVGRSTQHFAGVGGRSAARTLNGADSTFSIRQFPAGREARNEKVIVYSGVTMPNDASARFPTAGVVYTTWHHSFGSDSDRTNSWRNLIVWFDGTRNPEAYIDGKRYTIDLVTQLATPRPTD